jgi:GNAT superfamily N-acetyltransferase
MSQIIVKPVTTKKEMQAFIHFPWRVYRSKDSHYPNWVPPLLVDEKHTFGRNHNKFFNHADEQEFLAYKDGELVGRISAMVDWNYVDYQKKKDGFFGFFEALNDVDVALALHKAADDYLKERGMERVLGPVNQSTGHILGCLISAFDIPPVAQMGYNPEYYQGFHEAAGFEKEIDLRSYIMATTLPLSDKIKRVSEMARKRSGVEIRKADVKNWAHTVDVVREIWNDAWSDNWGFTPWTKEEFAVLAADLKMIMDNDMVLMAYIDGEPAGFAFPFPDVNEIMIKMNGRLLPTGIFKLLSGLKKVKALRIAAFGVKKKFQNKGVDAAFVYDLYTQGQAKGYTGADFSWILETNQRLINMLENWGASHYKTHRIFRKKLV